ncbi:nitrogen permease regulator of amino acid transport activity 3-domain-containing protein [Cantharellus anzutake]|uniref:nitrogen permease regulator of amino acid transport activity 3-domain-containing protein n=1 Tax=Cantharellus anzutake TaxID=1750568 RepID=UPI001907575F|nr:nitrogen permease regulator of amino acid transport activity 3-domain-containing protein [Cantharellus anzutake]KAF8344246.1 nitrogen permease regulator of amino acid transport activity 3-domain-containing protein [Cantharellus anzutake]
MTTEIHSDLLAILLVADSSNGANLVFRWPPKPHVPVRLARPRPPDYLEPHHLVDAAYIASHALDEEKLKKVVEEHGYIDKPSESLDPMYLWQPYKTEDLDCLSLDSGHEGSTKSFHAPAKEETPSGSQGTALDMYEDLIGYQASFLAELLSPKPALCHQKFELSVDDIAFVGHPVHAKEDGGWSFPEIYERSPGTEIISGMDQDGPRGRTEDRRGPPGGQSQKARFHFADDSEDGDNEEQESDARTRLRPKSVNLPSGPPTPSASPSPFRTAPGSRKPLPSASKQNLLLKSFHLVLVLDRPDPSSVASTDLDRYMDAYYQQVSFRLTAVMLYEQGRNGYVAQETDNLIRLRENVFVSVLVLSGLAGGDSQLPQSSESRQSPTKQFEFFFQKALKQSTIALAIKSAYEAVVSSSLAQVMINTIPVNIQLPPGHLNLLKVDQPQPDDIYVTAGIPSEEDWWNINNGGEEEEEEGTEARLEDELRFGWKIPPLKPWKSFLLLDDANNPSGESGMDALIGDRPRDHNGKDPLSRLLKVASPTLSLHEMSDICDLKLETEMYSLVRLLVYNRKARVCDVVRKTLTNIYVPASVLPRPLSDLSALFSQLFPTLSPLPSLLSAISATHRPFNALLPVPHNTANRKLFLRALIWMLANDVVVMLHVRVRIVVTTEIKVIALKVQREERDARVKRKEMLDQRRRSRSIRRASDSKNGYSNGPDRSASPRIPIFSQGNKSIERLDEKVGWADPVIPTTPSRDSLQASGRRVTPPPLKTIRVITPTHSKSRSRGSREPSRRSRQGSYSRHTSSTAALFHQISENGHDGEEIEFDEGSDLGEELPSEEDEMVEKYGQPPKTRIITDSTEVETSELEEEEDTDLSPSFLVDPERATRAQRRWLDAMCIGKDEYLVRWFKKVSPYFDGKKTTDEILHRTEISRKQLREVLHHFEEYLMLMLHP